MSEGEKLGVAAALDAAIEEAGGIEGEGAPWIDRAEQLPLAIVAPTEDAAAAEAADPGPRGRGRPAGSRNRRTNELADYILNRFPSPVVALAAIYSRPTKELAKELGCKPVEALKVQKEAAAAVASYVHQKTPVAIQVDAENVVRLVIVEPGAGESGQPGDDAVTVTVLDNDEQKQ